MKIKLNVDLRGKKAGDIIDTAFLSYEDTCYWQRRIEDAKIDKCCEIVADKKSAKKEI